MKRNNDWKKVTKNSYEAYAQEFASFTTIFRGKMQKWIDYFADDLGKGASILDVGCGAGRDVLYLSKKGLNMTGIDFSKELISIARKKAPKARFFVMNFEHLRFPQRSFDGVWAHASLLHLPKHKLLATLKKIYKILKNNGLFFSSFRVGEGERFTSEKRGTAKLERFYAYYQPEEVYTLLKRAKFRNITKELDTIETGDWVAFFARR